MAANAEAMPHTPTALERLKIAFIEATAAEQDDFVEWARMQIERRVSIERLMEQCPEGSPPDVRMAGDHLFDAMSYQMHGFGKLFRFAWRKR